MNSAVLTLSQELIDDFPVSDPRWAESIPAGLCVTVNLSLVKRKNTIDEVFYQWSFNRFTICNKMIQTIGLEFYRGLLDVIDNCLCRSKLERLMRDLFEDQTAIIEDRITVLVLLRRAYCHTMKLAPCLYEKI